MKKQAALAVFLMLCALPAMARPWKPQGPVLAQDYSVITDSRPGHELVEVLWMTWPMTATASQAVRQLLDHYLIIGVAHGRVDVGGKMVFDKEGGVEAAGLDGTALTSLPENNYPPAVSGAVATMGSFMRQSMGAMGEGMKFVVFDSGSVRACEKGKLSVKYAGETYAYDTPIPGCPAP
jgi:hypothetical protein